MPISISDHPLKEQIFSRARQAGFDLVAITRPDATPDAAARLAAYIAQGRHGDMEWMAETEARRASAQTLWPEAKSIIMLAMNYGPDDDPLARLSDKDIGNISVYARHRDYHDLVKSRLKQVARWLAETTKAEVKVFVDTAPVMEKPLAQAAGLGWQGKHTNLVSRDYGSWLFLGSIFTTLDLEADAPETDHCGQCSRCLDICPTNAFPAPYQLDARRCISYLTIENKGHIAAEFRKPIGNRIYGCDDCLAVCPWNKFAQSARELSLRPRDDLIAPQLTDLVQFDDTQFRAFFSGSPVKRITRTRFIRNVLIALGNSGDTSAVPHVIEKLSDASPIIRAMAVWALNELAPAEARARRADALASEEDEAVLKEWAAILSPPPWRGRVGRGVSVKF
ncbi:MAG: tRNA epoxyqueuosine(34) reductase QueG [Parvibaculum sp.]|nr:tRNA epoxyqueuosine(34) reductase QueG [Parvibaculum sp.]